MMFWDPITSHFSTFADYTLDIDQDLPDTYLELVYGGAFTSHRVFGHTSPKELFPPGVPVYARVDSEFYEGTVVSVPTSQTPWYQIFPAGGDSPFNVDLLDLSSPDDPLFPVDRYTSEDSRELPPWISNQFKTTLMDGAVRLGYLALTDNLLWNFVQRDERGSLTFRYPLHNLRTTWKERVMEGSLDKGWPSGHSSRALKVSAKGMQRGVPSSFKQSMHPKSVDHIFWKQSYCEEYESLNNQHTYEIINRAHYMDKFSHISILPTMVVQTIKTNEHGEPDRTKSRVVALGNCKDNIWTK